MKNLRARLPNSFLPPLTRQQITRLAAEFAVIFTSIVLALVADDWRDRRNERVEERNALALIARDLKEDELSLQVYVDHLEQQTRAATLLFALVHDPTVSSDSLAGVLNRAVAVWNYRPASAAYRGLMESGRLYLITREALRDSVILHYDEAVVYIADVRDQLAQWNDRAIQLLQRHVGARPSEDGRWRGELTSSRARLAADTITLNAVAYASRRRAYLQGAIRSYFLPSNLALQDAIGAYVEAER